MYHEHCAWCTEEESSLFSSKQNKNISLNLKTVSKCSTGMNGKKYNPPLSCSFFSANQINGFFCFHFISQLFVNVGNCLLVSGLYPLVI